MKSDSLDIHTLEDSGALKAFEQQPGCERSQIGRERKKGHAMTCSGSVRATGSLIHF